ncbi:MAG: J domain-containing protein [Lysobacter sp.]|nr:J domain-containing protein [Lysobacter sp.]
MAEDTDFGALYRELGIDSTCSLAELRGAWRRRVSKLHPDQGGSAEDTGQLQQLNRLYDAALDFHMRYRRMPGAMPSGQLSPERLGTDAGSPSFAGDPHPNPLPASGFGRISRYFVTVSLVAIAVLGWRVVENKPEHGRDRAAGAGAGRVAAIETSGDRGTQPARTAKPLPATLAIAPGMGKNTVRDILGEPLDMHALRWSYGPSWVEFRCDKVVDWYSSPLRPLRVSAARDARARAVAPDDRDCD